MSTNPEFAIGGDDKNTSYGEAIDRQLSIAVGEEANGTTEGQESANGDGAGEGEQQQNQSGGERQAAKPDSKGDSQKRDAQSKPDKAAKEGGQGDTSNPGDLKLQDGTVVKAGAERRFYEQAQLHRQEAANYKNAAKQATDNYNRVKQEMASLQSNVQSLHGMDASTVKLGATIVADLQRDPVGTINKLLTEIKANGINIDGVGGAGVDHAAMQRMIDARLGPITQQQDAQAQERQTQQEAANEVTAFYTRFPDARPHDQTIALVLRDYPHLSLDEAYYGLRQQFIEKGYDWSRPLAEQVASAAQAGQQQQSPDNKPMPNGRAPVGVKPAAEAKIASENTSIDDIIKESMRENGYNV